MRVNLIINDTCQLNCTHCCLNGKTHQRLSIAEWSKVYDILTEITDHIHIAGKEPLYDDYFLQFISDPRFTYSLVTNGINLPMYEEYLTHLTSIVISHDLYHNRPFPSIDPSLHYSASIVLTKERTSVMSMAKPLSRGIWDFYIAPVIPFNAATIKDIVPIQNYFHFYHDLKAYIEAGTITARVSLDVKKPYIDMFSVLPRYWECENGSIYLDTEYHCRKGLHEITICPDGEVLGCFFDYDRWYMECSFGNILVDPIDEIIKRGMIVRRENIRKGGCPASQYHPCDLHSYKHHNDGD